MIIVSYTPNSFSNYEGLYITPSILKPNPGRVQGLGLRVRTRTSPYSQSLGFAIAGFVVLLKPSAPSTQPQSLNLKH